MSLKICQSIQTSVLEDKRVTVSFLDTGQHLDFDIRRDYFTYSVPAHKNKGMYALKKLQQRQCLNGGFEVNLDDEIDSNSFCLNKSNIALYICLIIWHELKSFSSGAVCFVVAPDIYDSDDYSYDYSNFFLLSEQL